MLKLARTDGENDEFEKLRISLTYDQKLLFWLAVQANLLVKRHVRITHWIKVVYS